MSAIVATQLRENPRRRWLEPDVEQLLSTDVDDLVKYNILRFLHESPATVGNAAFFAEALGFHSATKTQAALEQLSAAGILEQWAGPRHGDVVYGLTADTAILQRLQKLCALPVKSPGYAEVVRKLAARSLRKAESSAKQMRAALRSSRSASA